MTDPAANHNKWEGLFRVYRKQFLLLKLDSHWYEETATSNESVTSKGSLMQELVSNIMSRTRNRQVLLSVYLGRKRRHHTRIERRRAHADVAVWSEVRKYFGRISEAKGDCTRCCDHSSERESRRECFRCHQLLNSAGNRYAGVTISLKGEL